MSCFTHFSLSKICNHAGVKNWQIPHICLNSIRSKFYFVLSDENIVKIFPQSIVNDVRLLLTVCRSFWQMKQMAYIVSCWVCVTLLFHSNSHGINVANLCTFAILPFIWIPEINMSNYWRYSFHPGIFCTIKKIEISGWCLLALGLDIVKRAGKLNESQWHHK